MLYVNGTIDRKDGKRLTEKRANAVFDAFVEWLEETQGCMFGGSFNPTYKDGDHVCTDNTASGPFVELVEGVKWTYIARKAPKRKKKR